MAPCLNFLCCNPCCNANIPGFTIKYPHTPGYDFSGVIEEVAPDVTTGFKIGDEVFAMHWLLPNTHNNEFGESAGTCAEYIQFPVSYLAKKPPNVSHVTAAAMPMVSLTGEVIMRMTNIQEGSKVLIIGGSSAVGSIAIQCAKRRGAHVTTTCSGRAIEFVSQFGADKIINYGEQNWWEELSDLDFVCDVVGEKCAWANAQLKNVIKQGGSFISLANPESGFYLDKHRPRFHLAGFWGSGVCEPRTLEILADLVAKDELKVIVESVYPFTNEGIKDIFTKVDGKKSLGKNVLQIVA